MKLLDEQTVQRVVTQNLCDALARTGFTVWSAALPGYGTMIVRQHLLDRETDIGGVLIAVDYRRSVQAASLAVADVYSGCSE
jgi:hypothetical protein